MSLPFGRLAWSPYSLMHLGQALPMMLTSSPNHGSKNSKSSSSSLGSNFDNLVFGSKGNHFRSRMSTTCARPNFSSFLAISFKFKRRQKISNATVQVIEKDSILVNLLPFFYHHHKHACCILALELHDLLAFLLHNCVFW